MAYVRTGDTKALMNALKTAIRWELMNCKLEKRFG